MSNATGLVLPYVETWLANQSLAGFVSRIDADADDPPLYFLSEAQRQVLYCTVLYCTTRSEHVPALHYTALQYCRL